MNLSMAARASGTMILMLLEELLLLPDITGFGFSRCARNAGSTFRGENARMEGGYPVIVTGNCRLFERGFSRIFFLNRFLIALLVSMERHLPHLTSFDALNCIGVSPVSFLKVLMK